MSARTAQGRATRTTRAWVQQVMGLPVSIHLRAADTDRPDLRSAVDAAYERLRLVDTVFSTWSEDSDVMRLRRGVLDPADAHPWIATVREVCDQAREATGGLFSTDLLGPDGSRGWDPTGLVKGWGLQEAVRPLDALPGVQFCANAGGDLTCGSGPDSESIDSLWHVGIEDREDPQSISRVVQLRGGGLATSGTGARGRHIVDPSTGAPVAGDLTSISVSGPDLMWADVWATASFVDPDALAMSRDPRWKDYEVVGRTGEVRRGRTG